MIKQWLNEVENSSRFYVSSGSGIKDDMMLKVVDGRKELVKFGEHNLYGEIQSHKDSVDIYSILARYQAGDISVLDRYPAVFADVSNSPKSLAEAYEFFANASEQFKSLPLEIREAYDHNFQKFMDDFGSDHYNELLKKVFKDQVDSKKSDAESYSEEVTHEQK